MVGPALFALWSRCFSKFYISFFQKQTVELVPLTKVDYEWKERVYSFYIFGNENKVYTKDYPAKCCCSIMWHEDSFGGIQQHSCSLLFVLHSNLQIFILFYLLKDIFCMIFRDSAIVQHSQSCLWVLFLYTGHLSLIHDSIGCAFQLGRWRKLFVLMYERGFNAFAFLWLCIRMPQAKHPVNFLWKYKQFRMKYIPALGIILHESLQWFAFLLLIKKVR